MRTKTLSREQMALEKNEGDNEISSKALIVGGNVGGLRDFCNIKSIKEGNIEPG